jgi:DNA-binding LacI/PurR family transcriptional regulator
MAELWEDLRIAKADSPQSQIRLHVRRLILDGKLAPGVQLPPTKELAQTWKTHVATVHGALIELVREGLLIRRKGRGTFVAPKIAALHDIGIYCESEVLLAPWHWFDRSVIGALCDIARTKGYETHIWTDSRDRQDRHKVWAEMETAVAERKIQALVRISPDPEAQRWIAKLSLPVTWIGIARNNPDPRSIDCDMEQLGRDAVAKLAEQGCRSVGLISADDAAGVSDFHRAFTATAQRLGLEMRAEWMRLFTVPRRGGYGHLDFGYNEVTELAEMAEQPDGLVIWPDIVVEGALSAMAIQRIAVPDKLKLVLHRNEGHRYDCPFPVTYAVTRETEIAAAFIQQLEKQLAGEKCTPQRIPFHLIPSTEMDAGRPAKA